MSALIREMVLSRTSRTRMAAVDYLSQEFGSGHLHAQVRQQCTVQHWRFDHRQRWVDHEFPHLYYVLPPILDVALIDTIGNTCTVNVLIDNEGEDSMLNKSVGFRSVGCSNSKWCYEAHNWSPSVNLRCCLDTWQYFIRSAIKELSSDSRCLDKSSKSANSSKCAKSSKSGKSTKCCKSHKVFTKWHIPHLLQGTLNALREENKHSLPQGRSSGWCIWSWTAIRWGVLDHHDHHHHHHHHHFFNHSQVRYPRRCRRRNAGEGYKFGICRCNCGRMLLQKPTITIKSAKLYYDALEQGSKKCMYTIWSG